MTASKLAHGTKLAALVITVAAGITIPQWFTCQDLRLFDREKMILFGIPSLISASVNIAVSAYISYKMVTKKTPEENTELRARYERDDDRVFIEVPTVSQAVQNQNDLFLEDIEEYDDSIKQQVSSSVFIPNDMTSPDQIEDLPTKRVTKKQCQTEIKRLNSRADMFYRMPVDTNQHETVSCFPALSLETLKKILKFNLITTCTVTMLLSNHIVTFYIILTGSCMSELDTVIVVSKVLKFTSVIIFPFLTHWKLHMMREEGFC